MSSNFGMIYVEEDEQICLHSIIPDSLQELYAVI